MLASRQFADAGVSAVFEEASGGGDIHDIASLRNRPAASPADWLANIQFHADFDYYQVESGPTSVAVNHASVAGATTAVVSLVGVVVSRVGQIVTSQIDLVTHGLGYVPRFMVIWNGAIVAPGTTVQTASGQVRTVTPYATTTKIRLRDVGISSASALAAMSTTYEVIVFRAPAVAGDELLGFDAGDGDVVLGQSKFLSELKMLRQAAAGDSPFDISLGPTIDIKNGGWRTVLADGTTLSHTLYNGSFAGSPSIQCAVE